MQHGFSGEAAAHKLLGYFGEAWTETNCGACDNCLYPPEFVDCTVDAQKLLSAVARVKEQVGLHHLIAVLLGMAAGFALHLVLGLVIAPLFGVIGVLISIPLMSLAMILVQALWIEPHEAAAVGA